MFAYHIESARPQKIGRCQCSSVILALTLFTTSIFFSDAWLHAAPQGPENLILDPGFETSPLRNGWWAEQAAAEPDWRFHLGGPDEITVTPSSLSLDAKYFT